MLLLEPSEPSLLLTAADTVEAGSLADTLHKFQDSHAFLISIVVAIATRYIIGDVRRVVEKPVMDKVTEKAEEQLTPDTEEISAGAWAKLALCVTLDTVGDASAALPGLGELTDVAYAPLEGALIFALFKSQLLGGIGFLEEILPFTDVIPTFCIGWCLQNLWPTTPLAKGLGVTKEPKQA